MQRCFAILMLIEMYLCIFFKPKTIHFSNLRINGCWLKAQFMQTLQKIAVPVSVNPIISCWIVALMSLLDNCSLDTKEWLHIDNYSCFLCDFFSECSVNLVVISECKNVSDVFKSTSVVPVILFSYLWI